MSGLSPLPEHPTSRIAARELVLVRNGERRALRIGIGLPVQDVDTVSGVDWRCPVCWEEAERRWMTQACGVDAYQALQVAMAMVQDGIAALSREAGVVLEFMGCPYDVQMQLPMAARGGGAD